MSWQLGRSRAELAQAPGISLHGPVPGSHPLQTHLHAVCVWSWHVSVLISRNKPLDVSARHSISSCLERNMFTESIDYCQNLGPWWR